MSITRLLIANRGEIAVRATRAARELGIETVAVFSDADKGTMHVRLADKRIALNGSRAADTYLNIEKIIHAVIQSGADAVYPGYGFLSENTEFAKALAAEKIKFVGPSAEVISLLGDKDSGRELAERLGIPTVPGSGTDSKEEDFPKIADRIGFPVIVKAVAGGSGRGMRVAQNAAELKDKIGEAKREALAGFGNDKVLIEKYLEHPRHIEVQILGDGRGNVWHFGERECSLQRRHQKVVEEAPAVNLNPKLRDTIITAAVQLGREVNYESAGTVEFLVVGGTKENDPFYFLEANTRIQVEHPVTEVVSRRDLVKLQLQIAGGQAINLKQGDITFTGHAIEYRVSSEDPREGFKPTTGEILYVSRPGGSGVREDGWVESGSTVSPYYDSLLSKIIVFGVDRDEAIIRSRRVLEEFTVEGISTTLGFHRWLLRQPDFVFGNVDVKWIERNFSAQSLESSFVGPLRAPKIKET